MFDRSLSPNTSEKKHGKMAAFIAAGLALVMAGGIAFGMRSVAVKVAGPARFPKTVLFPKRMAEPESKEIESDVYRLTETGHNIDGQDVSGAFNMVLSSDESWGVPFAPLPAFSVDEDYAEVAATDPASGVRVRFLRDSSGRFKVFQEAGNEYTVVRTTEETADGGIVTRRTIRLFGYELSSFVEKDGYTKRELNGLEAELTMAQKVAIARHNDFLKMYPDGAPVVVEPGQADNLAASIDIKETESHLRGKALAQAVLPQLIAVDGLYAFSSEGLSVLTRDPSALMAMSDDGAATFDDAFRLVWDGHDERGRWVRQIATPEGLVKLSVSKTFVPSDLVAGQAVPVYTALELSLPDTDEESARFVKIEAFPDSVSYSFGHKTAAGEKIAVALDWYGSAEAQDGWVSKREGPQDTVTALGLLPQIGLSPERAIFFARQLAALSGKTIVISPDVPGATATGPAVAGTQPR